MSALLRRRRRRGATARVLRGDGDGAAPLSPWVGRTLRFCGTLLALGGIAWGGWRGVDWMLREGEFPLRQVHLDGDLRNLGPEDAEAAVRPYLGRNFFRLDMGSLHAAFADNPWVQSVAVSRRWPDTVEVRFVERVPFAHWGRDEMIDTGAARFRPQPLQPVGAVPLLDRRADGVHHLAAARCHCRRVGVGGVRLRLRARGRVPSLARVDQGRLDGKRGGVGGGGNRGNDAAVAGRIRAAQGDGLRWRSRTRGQACARARGGA